MNLPNSGIGAVSKENGSVSLGISRFSRIYCPDVRLQSVSGSATALVKMTKRNDKNKTVITDLRVKVAGKLWVFTCKL